MKMLFTLSLLILAGCSMSSRMYNSLRNTVQRASALSDDGLAGAIKVHDSRTSASVEAMDEKVLVLARVPDNSPSVQFSVIQPETAKQVIESALIQGLHHKGYRSASRLNVKSVLQEQAFNPGKPQPPPPAEFFKGTTMLVVTVNRLQSTDEKYETFDGIWSRSQTIPLGRRVSAHLSAELFAANSSESIWSATAQLNELLLPSVSVDFVLEEMVNCMTKKLPSRAEVETRK